MGEEEERPLTFAELGVPGPLVRVLAADDKKTAFPIQADTLPDSLAGRDILGRGRTGSGKTLAFSIPLVARLGMDSVRDMAAAAGVNPNTMQRALAQLEAEGLVYTERTTGRFVTEDTALLEQLRDETARAMTAEYLEKMRGIGYGPAEAAKLMTGWETKESD